MGNCLKNSNDLEHHIINADEKVKSNSAFSTEFECQDASDYRACQHVNRLKKLLTYYNQWIIDHKDNNDDNDDIIGIYRYIRKGEKYSLRRLLNDYHHLINCHLQNNDTFEEIYNYFCEKLSNQKCVMNTCNMLTRNNRDRSRNRKSNAIYFMKNAKETISEQIMDQIHCYIYHTFDNGFKLTNEELSEIENDNENMDKIDNNIENEVHETMIKSRQRARQRDRIGRMIQEKKTANMNRFRGRDSNKFMSNISEKNDTQILFGVDEKMDENENAMNNDQDAMFSFGVRYYYDDEKKDNDALDIEYNITYKYSDWYIDIKYKEGLKQELLNNNNSRIESLQFKELEIKAQQYLKTDHILKNCKNITVENIISIMIYCNFDVLQNEYTKTYRYLNGEGDFDLKQRHLEFANLGKILTETVEKNGIRVESGNCSTFYHGINIPLLFTSTLHQFYGPVSTSSTYAVACMFTNNKGIILELNDGTLLSNEKECVYFDCEWISDFAYEKEKFFIGGKFPLKIVSIFHCKLNENYTVYIGLINILLTVLQGDISINEDGSLINYKNQNAINKLLRHKLKKDEKHIIDILPLYIDKLLNHICSNVHFITNKYDVTFATDKYKVFTEFLCSDQCQFFNLMLITELFPNLTSIAMERNILTENLFDNIYAYIMHQFDTDDKLVNNIIFKAPVKDDTNAQSLSFHQAIKLYNEKYTEYKWSIGVSEKAKDCLVIKSNKKQSGKSGHERWASTNLLKSQKTYHDQDVFGLIDFIDENFVND